MPYFSRADLENALGKSTVSAIFDDDGDNEAESSAILACLQYGSAECDSFLRGVYNVTFPITPVPDELKFAAIDFGCAYAVRRRPDLTRAMGDESWKSYRDAAIEKMERFVVSRQTLPASTGTPANVGADVVSGDPDNPDLPSPPRRWQDMGDF